MSIGKEIKVVLSLDDAGFSVKLKGARQHVQGLTGQLGGLTTGVDKAEKSIDGLAAELKTLPKTFEILNKSLASTMDRLQRNVSGGMAQTGRAAKASAKAAKDSATAQIDAKISVLEAEIAINKKMLEARGKTHADMRKMESDLRAQSTAAMLAAEKAERSKKKGSSAAVTANLNEADRLERNANALRREIAAIESWIGVTRQAQAGRVSTIASLEAERKGTLAAAQAKEQLDRMSKAVAKSNAEEVKRVRELAAARAADGSRAEKRALDEHARYKKSLVEQELRDRRQAELAKRREAAETLRQAKRDAIERARIERQENQAVAQMWRGMAATYSGAKVGQGLGASVNQGDQLERQKMLVGGLNLEKGEEAQFYKSAQDMADQLRFLSTKEAIESRMSAVASIGYNNKGIIDATLPTAVKAANNMMTLGATHGDLQSTIRNLYGVVEMRQQQYDAEASNKTFDLMQKIILGTGGKVQTQDMETVLRRMGMGANQLSDEGMLRLAAVVDQFKVAGGDGGGAGGGVSTVGTSFKMMQAYALGKGLSNTAVKEFAGAGVLAESGIDLSKDDAGILRDAKHGGFKNADLWLKDPVKAIQTIFPDIVKYTQSEKQRGKYYQGRDINDLENQLVAVSMYLARLGITTTSSAAMMVAGDPRSQKRIDKQMGTMQKYDGAAAMDKRQQESYARMVQETKAQLSELGQLVGTLLLPPLKVVLGLVGDLLRAVVGFARDNPLATFFTTAGVAISGAVLSVRGFMLLFGAGGLLGVFKSFLGMAPRVGAAMVAPAAAATSWTRVGAVLGGVATWMKGLLAPVGALLLRIPLLGGAVLKLGAALGIGGGFLKSFGSIFKALMGVMIAWDIGWMVGTWISTIKLGSLTIGQHMENLLTKLEVGYKRIVNKVERAALKTRNFLGIDSDAETAKRMGEIDGRDRALDTYERFMLNTAPDLPKKTAKQIADEKARKKALEEADLALKNSGKNPTTPGLEKVINAADKGSKRDDRDPLNEALGEAEGRLERNKEKLDAIIEGGETVESLRRQAELLIEGERKADNLSVLHLSKNRPAADDERVKLLKERTFQAMLADEQARALTFANERLAGATQEADAAMERIAEGGAPKQTDAMRALVRELERAEVRIGAGTDKFAKWERAKNRALFEQARSDAANFAAEYADKNREAQAGLAPTERARTEAELAAARTAEDEKFRIRKDALEKWRAASVKAILDEGPPTRAAQKEIERINAEALTAREAIEVAHGERRRVRNEEEARALETALQRQTREWQDVGKQIEDIGAGAANSFVNMLVNSLGSGRLAVGDFVKGVLTDIAAAKLKQTLASPLEGAINAGMSWVGQNLFGMADTAAETAATTATVARTTADTAATAATAALTAALGTAAFAAQAFAASAGVSTAGQVAGTVANVMFANGGIMTDLGPLPLRKYANGGIARSPQVAIYGEAGPEAYVPLPDGRTIPVTMTGGGAPNVQVNVINQSGQQMQAQQGQSRFDGKQMILDVVLTAATTPGPFRAGMKDAMK